MSLQPTIKPEYDPILEDLRYMDFYDTGLTVRDCLNCGTTTTDRLVCDYCGENLYES